RYRTELADCARIAQQHAVEQRPFHVRQGDAEQRLPTARTQHQRGFLVVRALLLHQRNEFARDKGQGYECGRDDNPGHAEYDFDSVRREPGAEQSLQSEQQHEDQTADHGRDRERKIDQRQQQVFPAKSEFRHHPCRRDPENRVERNDDERSQQRQPYGGHRFGLKNGAPVSRQPEPKRFGKDDDQRQDQEQRHEAQRDRKQYKPRRAAFRERQHHGRLPVARSETGRKLNHLASSVSTPEAG